MFLLNEKKNIYITQNLFLYSCLKIHNSQFHSMKLILSTITGAGANKIFVALAPAPQKYLKRLRLQLRLLQNWLAQW